MKKSTAELIVYEAVRHIYDTLPALAVVLSKMPLVEDASVRTFATDGRDIKFNPSFIETDNGRPLGIEEVAWVLAHELGHVILGHHLRGAEVEDKAKFNIACDLALNDLLRQIGLIMPVIFITQTVSTQHKDFQHLPTGETVETYLELLPDNPKQSKKKQQTPRDSDGQGRGGDHQGEGSSSGDGGIGEVTAHPGTSTPEGKARAEEAWRDKLADMVNASRGTAPGWLKELSGLVHESKHDWKGQLKRLMTEVTNQGSSWSRPSRRQFDSKLLLPATISQGAGHGLVLVDTSGSMDKTQMNVALDEIGNVLAAFPQAKVTMRMCDTRVIPEGERTFTRYEFPLRAEVTWRGRGGTDMVEAFAQIESESGKFKWVILISDMIWPTHATRNPRVPTIWVNVGCRKNFAPPFGVAVIIPR